MTKIKELIEDYRLSQEVMGRANDLFLFFLYG